MHPRLHRRPLLAAAAIAAVGLIASAVPAAVAASTPGSSAPTAHRGGLMYNITVRANDGDSLALAGRLNRAGFDVMYRLGATVHVLGGAATAQQLAGVSGVTISGRVVVGSSAKPPAGPANQNKILPRKLHGKKYPTYFGGYRTVKGYDEFEDDLVAAYPSLVQKIVYGTSYDGLPLNAICITAKAQDSCQLQPNVHKARFFLMAQIHAREIATSEVAWRYMTELINGWKHDAEITSLLKSTEIWVVPQVNPDGITTVQQGIKKDGTSEDSPAYQRKNMDETETPPGGCGEPWELTQPGVDLNRNFGFKWGGQGTSQNPCDQEYLGPSQNSEPETTALEGLFKELFRQQGDPGSGVAAPKNTTGTMITMHTNGDVLLLPWDYDDTVHAPNDAQLRAFAFRQSYFNGYDTGQAGQVLYNASGTTDDWTYATLGIASYTWELWQPGACGDDFLVAYSCMDGYAQNNLPGLIYTAAGAREPYKLGLGPTILNAQSSESGGSVSVSATADDAAYGSQGVGRPTPVNVKAARIYVGKAPWDRGKAQAMTIKGSGTSVTISASVTPGAKRQLAWVQAQNANGDWGPAWAVWIPAAS